MESRQRPRVLIADDHKLVAEACKSLLEPEFDVVGVVTDGRTLMLAAEQLHPDVVILDLSMPGLNGLDAGEQIKHKSRFTKLIFLTMSLRPDLVVEAFRRGASGYVLKQCSDDELLIAVRRVLRGESYFSPLLTNDTVKFLLHHSEILQLLAKGKSMKNEQEKHLSIRQSEVLQLLAEGKSMNEVAYTLQLKPETVAFHKLQIMITLGIKTDDELIEYAVRHHMIRLQ